MGYKNLKEMAIDATKLPAAIEGKLPAVAPKVSVMLADFASRWPDLPNLPVEIPALPEPKLPALPGAPATLRRYVTSAEVRPVKEVTVAPVGRGKIPFVYE